MLVIEGLTKTFRAGRQPSGSRAPAERPGTAPRPALDKVSVSVRKGSFTALLGPNGAGKSTLIGIIAGTVRPDEGTVVVNGYPLDSRAAGLKMSLGIVPQEVSFEPLFTVAETLSLQSGYFGIRRNRERTGMLLDRLSLWDKRHATVRSLSGGMKRRLLIAKALVHDPRLLLLDEPTAGVDVQLRIQLHEFLRALNRDGLTIVLTTHYLEEAERLCDRVILLHEGRVRADAPSKEFLRLAGDHFTVSITTARPDLMRAALSRFGPVPRESGNGVIQLSVPGPLRARFLSVLGDHAAAITSLRIEEPGIEDVFLKLTEAGKEEGSAAIA